MRNLGQKGGGLMGRWVLWGIMVLCLLAWVSVKGGHAGGDTIWTVKNGVVMML